ncbi:protein of unassigned function [Methylobacterium oryzae CBMB20]|uniref:Protein of unassigned function n=1 Tax=Methylobacterium oryzae CBMB20 TaxID=693986 RepID=A0A089QEJ2_9HYPH|nr:protein of unassigned function [Methylobacterium oryzae CBMB20]
MGIFPYLYWKSASAALRPAAFADLDRVTLLDLSGRPAGQAETGTKSLPYVQHEGRSEIRMELIERQFIIIYAIHLALIILSRCFCFIVAMRSLYLSGIYRH